MKQTFTRLPLFLLPFLFLFISCTKDTDEHDEIYIIRGMAQSIQTGGANESNALAAISGGYSSTYKKLAFNISWSGLSSAPTGAGLYFSEGLSNDSTIMIFPVTEGHKNGLSAGELFITDKQASDLMNGNWYYTVNTVDHPNGELIGKVSVVKNQ